MTVRITCNAHDLWHAQNFSTVLKITPDPYPDLGGLTGPVFAVTKEMTGGFLTEAMLIDQLKAAWGKSHQEISRRTNPVSAEEIRTVLDSLGDSPLS